nr:MAG TPA: hypothetical protein [Caudoviricetes sp.]
MFSYQSFTFVKIKLDFSKLTCYTNFIRYEII